MSESARVALAVEKFKSMQRAANRIAKIRRDLEKLLPTMSDEEISAYFRITEELATDD